MTKQITWNDLEEKKMEFDGNGRSFSDKLIVLSDKGICDDVRCMRVNNSFSDERPDYKYVFIAHAFGYDNDQFHIEGVTHWIYLKDLMPL